jgi:hypothetical protein
MSITRFETRLRGLKEYFKRFTLKKADKNPPVEPDKIIAQVQAVKPLSMKQRLVVYLKTVANDYKDVGMDTLKTMREKPAKASVYIACGLSAYALYKYNPTALNYQNCLVEYSNDVLLCGESTRNRLAINYLNDMHKLSNNGLLTHKSFVLFSLVKRVNFNKECDLYDKHCKQLNKPSPWNILNQLNLTMAWFSSIVDIGLFDYWIFLNRNLKDYDVNTDEWTNSDS